MLDLSNISSPISLFQQKTNSPEYSDWKVDPTLPPGWKIRFTNGKYSLMDHQRRTFRYGLSAVKHLKDNNVSKEEITGLRTFLISNE